MADGGWGACLRFWFVAIAGRRRNAGRRPLGLELTLLTLDVSGARSLRQEDQNCDRANKRDPSSDQQPAVKAVDKRLDCEGRECSAGGRGESRRDGKRSSDRAFGRADDRTGLSSERVGDLGVVDSCEDAADHGDADSASHLAGRVVDGRPNT